MSLENLFLLTEAQQHRLLTCRAVGEEGEDEERLERLRQREEDVETLRAFQQLLQTTRFAEGGELSFVQTTHLLSLVRTLAPNPNLDARLLRRPDEPATFLIDLRDLLFGSASVPLRLRHFLTRRHVGGQTALQLLSAMFPTDWPLITRLGLRVLELSPVQKSGALQEARQRCEAGVWRSETEVSPSEGGQEVAGRDPVPRLLADVVVYEAVRECVQASNYLEVHRLLTQGLAAKPRRGQSTFTALRYSSPSDNLAEAALRETGTPYHQDEQNDEEGDGEDPSKIQNLKSKITPPDISGASVLDLLTYLENYVIAKGFTYPALTVRNYYISLQTKPFVLLSGLSGTGKTRLTTLFAEALTGSTEGQYRLLPVRPDWADSTPLLGYVNLLARGGEGKVVSTPFLDFLRLATRPENSYRAFFLCLDEMNLARVEHYFAEILSAMETATKELLLPEGRLLRLPANLFLTGTLNLDEATHALSRKVLDRANTVAFQEVCLHEEATEPTCQDIEEPTSLLPQVRQALFLQERITTVSAARERLRQFHTGKHDFATEVVQTLTEANRFLEPHGLHFAYRVRDEVLRYCANSFDKAGQGLLLPNAPDDKAANLRTALDLQLLQKVLPRLGGTREQMELPMQALLRWAEKSVFPQTTRKLSRLLTRLQRDGFASFEES